MTSKVVVVAGGATGIGAATSRRLGADGWSVIVGDLNASDAEHTAAAILDRGGVASAVPFDLADPDSVAELMSTAGATYGGLDALFCVGADMSVIRSDTDVVDIDLGVWDHVMAVNLRGYVAALKYAIPGMLTRGGGAIVTMSSAAAFQGEPTRPAYATAKAGIGALTRHVASRWGKDGIRCNAVAPGFTATEAIRAAPQWPQLESSALERMRSPRVGEADDVAALVSFLMSDDGAWINGQVINVDGGTILR
ncbi:MAG: SDR family NAD(P)-dependent oxidoreductase [Mycobacterium sp.]|nr:SDR family NAD(P)-dependent oxidoreductase [Mycobacterium sp.]